MQPIEPIDQPSLTASLSDRAAQRERLSMLFQAHPLQDIEPEELREITPHYQQRISELRRQKHDPMTIKNVPRSLRLADGTVKKLDGAYRFQPYGESLGRDAGQPVGQSWASDGPFTPEFRLR